MEQPPLVISKCERGIPRRSFIAGVTGALLAVLFAPRVRAQELCTEAEVTTNDASACLSKSTISKDQWLDGIFGKGLFDKPLSVSRFLDRTYYLNRELTWTSDDKALGPVTVVVPKGFVTDFASIPRLFWSVLAPDDEYVMAAVVHDWLYWQQSLNRESADDVLRLGMEDLRVATWKTAAIYRAVRMFGQTAWDENARLKKTGERRVLKVVPEDATVRWSEWKAQRGAF